MNNIVSAHLQLEKTLRLREHNGVGLALNGSDRVSGLPLRFGLKEREVKADDEDEHPGKHCRTKSHNGESSAKSYALRRVFTISIMCGLL